jgi:hypothetical protein
MTEETPQEPQDAPPPTTSRTDATMDAATDAAAPVVDDQAASYMPVDPRFASRSQRIDDIREAAQSERNPWTSSLSYMTADLFALELGFQEVLLQAFQANGVSPDELQERCHSFLRIVKQTCQATQLTRIYRKDDAEATNLNGHHSA